jgi:hypothetical protein
MWESFKEVMNKGLHLVAPAKAGVQGRYSIKKLCLHDD